MCVGSLGPLESVCDAMRCDARRRWEEMELEREFYSRAKKDGRDSDLMTKERSQKARSV